MCTYSVCSEFLALRTKSSASMALTKKTTQTNKKKTTTKQNNPPPPQKKEQQKKQQKTTKNSNKLITKTDKTQQTNVALATARAYKIYVTNVSVFLLFLFIVSSIWGKMVLKPYSRLSWLCVDSVIFRRWFCSLCSSLWHMCSMVVLRKLKNTECSLRYYFLTYKMGYT